MWLHYVWFSVLCFFSPWLPEIPKLKKKKKRKRKKGSQQIYKFSMWNGKQPDKTSGLWPQTKTLVDRVHYLFQSLAKKIWNWVLLLQKKTCVSILCRVNKIEVKNSRHFIIWHLLYWRAVLNYWKWCLKR